MSMIATLEITTPEELNKFVSELMNKPSEYYVVKGLIARGIDVVKFREFMMESNLSAFAVNRILNMYDDIKDGRFKL